MKFYFQEVDASDEFFRNWLIHLHDATFGKRNPQPNYSSGWWWIVYKKSLKGKKTPIGFCGMISVPGGGYLTRAGVLYRYRGHGLQRRMIRVRERKARKMKFKWMVSDTCGTDHSANNLIKCGYEFFTPQMPWALKKSVYWRKLL